MDDSVSLADLSPDERFSLSDYDKVRLFGELNVTHHILEGVINSMVHLLCPHNGIPILVLAGASGVGKSCLLKSILPGIVRQKDFRRPGGIVYVEAPAIGEQKVRLKAFYALILQAGKDAMIDKKVAFIVEDGKLNVKYCHGQPTVDNLRDWVVAMLKYRQHLALAIDEVVHLLKFRDAESVLDMIKALAHDDCPKIVVVGDFNLTERARTYEQYVRRGRTVFLSRYDSTLAKPTRDAGRRKRQDAVLDQFLSILMKFRAYWPWKDCLNVDAHCPQLLWQSLGNIGLLKQILSSCLELQNDSKGNWSDKFLQQSYLPEAQRSELETSFKKGEEEMRKFDCLRSPANFFAREKKPLR